MAALPSTTPRFLVADERSLAGTGLMLLNYKQIGRWNTPAAENKAHLLRAHAEWSLGAGRKEGKCITAIRGH
jgi:hypothetical protein